LLFVRSSNGKLVPLPASITLSDVSLSTPDGRTLSSGINLNFKAERAGLVGRNGVGKTTLLSLIADRRSPQAGTRRSASATSMAMTASGMSQRNAPE
jgi:ATPase subunit of ABC transporter with duplicated ATPase domains